MSNAWSMLSGLGTGLLNLGFSGISSSRQAKYAIRAMNHQDYLNRQYTRDSYGLMREGLEKAGYNPLLALGSSANGAIYNGSASATDSDSGSQSVQSAIAVKQLQNETEQTKSNIASQDASSALANEQAKTEQSKRVNLDFQNAMLDVQKHLADKDLSWYDRKANATLYELMQRAERYQAQSAIDSLNAQTRKQEVANNYNLGKYENETSRMNAYSNSKNARTNAYNADTQRGKRSFGGFGFNATFTPRNYNQGGYFMN